jgi:periplasmic protein TonB
MSPFRAGSSAHLPAKEPALFLFPALILSRPQKNILWKNISPGSVIRTNKQTIMDISTLRNADYLDIVFDNRNKAYGGYELRRHYGNRVGKAIAIIYSLLAALILFLYLRPHTAAPVRIIETHTIDPTWIDPPLQPVLPPRRVDPPAPAMAKIKTDLFTAPVITNENIPDDKHMTDVKTLQESTAGTGTEGDNDHGIGLDKTQKGTGDVIIPDPKPEPPRRIVEQMPLYNGDINAYLAANVRYPEAARESGIEGRVQIEFVVDEQGNVTNAHILRGIGGGCDEEALRVVAAMPRWKPGRQNGTPVKVYFSLVVKFLLQ